MEARRSVVEVKDRRPGQLEGLCQAEICSCINLRTYQESSQEASRVDPHGDAEVLEYEAENKGDELQVEFSNVLLAEWMSTSTYC